MARGKRYQEEKKAITQKKYDFAEAFEVITKSNKLKFDPSIDIAIKLNIDKSRSDQTVRGTIEFPNPTGKVKKVIAFVTPEKVKAAKDAGADIAGSEELVDEIKKSGKTDFDVAIAEPAAMKFVGRVAKILGPRGLMPNPKDGTVTPKIEEEIKSIKAGKATFKNDDDGNLHVVIGKLSIGVRKLAENAVAFLGAVKKAKPDSIKTELISNIVVSSSQGPGIKIG